LMLSAGMLCDLASAMTVRRRGLLSGSPPPLRAATVSSLMMRVKIFPRLASAAPFLCLIVCHLECPDMACTSPEICENGPEMLTRRARTGSVLPCHEEPRLGRGRPGRARVVASDPLHAQAGRIEPACHLVHRDRPE